MYMYALRRVGGWFVGFAKARRVALTCNQMSAVIVSLARPHESHANHYCCHRAKAVDGRRHTTDIRANIKRLLWSSIDIGAQWGSVQTLGVLNAGTILGGLNMPTVGPVLRYVDFDQLCTVDLVTMPAELVRRARDIHRLELGRLQPRLSVYRIRPRHMSVCLRDCTIGGCAHYFENCDWRLESLSIILEYGVVSNAEDVSLAVVYATELICRLSNECLTSISIAMNGWLTSSNTRNALQLTVHQLIRYCIKTCSSLRELSAKYHPRDDSLPNPDEIPLYARTFGRHDRLRRLELQDCVVMDDDAGFVHSFPRLERVSRTRGERRMIGRQCALGGSGASERT